MLRLRGQPLGCIWPEKGTVMKDLERVEFWAYAGFIFSGVATILSLFAVVLLFRGPLC